MAKPIENEWRSFCKACFDEHLQWTHPVQYQDLRRAFYGGAKAMMNVLMRKLSAGDDATEEDLQMLRDAMRELNEFSEQVKRGAA